MHYEINVSLLGVHYFATAERSITTLEKLQQVYPNIRARFTQAAGFEVSVTRYETVGTVVYHSEIQAGLNKRAAMVAGPASEVAELDPEACPGCGCMPGDGITDGCTHPEGCGYYALMVADEASDGGQR